MHHTPSQSSAEQNMHEVVPGIWQLTVPIPFPLKTVNMYLLVNQSGWAIIDTAIATAEVRTILYAALQHLGLQLATLKAIVLTHNHLDHIGLASELHEQSGAPIYMHPIDAANMYTLWGDEAANRAKDSLAFLTRHGLRATESWQTGTSGTEHENQLPLPPRAAIVAVEDGEQIELAGATYRVIWTPGHADGQICLFRAQDGLFISADHILARITPNIGIYASRGRPDPLADYLQSLHKVESLPAQITLPGHGPVFTAPQVRIVEIIEHHQHRLQKILELLAPQPQQANQLMEQLFRDRLRDAQSRLFALAEVIAHLEYLTYSGQLIRQQNEAGILYSVVC